MRPQSYLYLILGLATVLVFSACTNEMKNAESPFYGRKGSVQASNTSGSTTTPNTSGGSQIQGLSGKLIVNSINQSGQNAVLNATYQSSAGVSLPIQISTAAPNYVENQSQNGSNGSYFYAQSACGYTTSNCDSSYFSILVIDYNTDGNSYKYSDFGVAKINGSIKSQYYSQFEQSLTSYVTVEYVMQSFGGH